MSSRGVIIELDRVSKRFRRHAGPKLIRERIADLFRPRNAEDLIFHALTDVSFRVYEGEGVGLIGSNGAGKSTTLNLIAGLARPDAGTVRTAGRIAALLELGSGFHPDLTGEENISLNAALLGMSGREMRQQKSSIVEFAEIGHFIREPLRTYSSGMMVRLAFAIAVHLNPSVLIIDEVLGVGDSHFQKKSLNKIAALRAEGKTLVCVSHSPETVRTFCDRAIWLHKGIVMADGAAAPTLSAYESFVAAGESAAPAVQ